MRFDDLKQKYEIINKLIDAINDEELITLSKFMRSRIYSPDSYVTLLGETSSGKTTLLNGLIGNNILKTSAAPTTGAIVEVVFDDTINTPEYYAVNRDATMESVDNNTFISLSTMPDDMLSRLQVVVPNVMNFSGLRLFDTPGYGSIVDNHEEVLKEFIPNSDVIIYVIGYKIGIQENDFLFMRYIQELIHDDTEVIIVVNRCPEGISDSNRRLKEIQRYADDLFHRSIPVFTVKTEQNEFGKTLPFANKVWSYIRELLSSQERQDILVNTLNLYLDDLLREADKAIEKLEFSRLTSKKEKEDLKTYASDLRKKGKNIINSEIIPTFNRLISETPKLLKNSKNIVYDNISTAIDNENTGRMDETIVFVNNHLLPMTINRETKEYERRLMIELDAMNERVDDYLNQVIADYYHDIELRLTTNVELAARISGGKIVSKFMENGLKQYFAAYGGAGGAGAGVANAAKHWLKKTGDLFGKKFSTKTYSTLAKTLKKIGATSAKAIGNAVTVIIEVAQVIFDYTTWKNKLKKQVSKGLDDWCNKTIETVTKDLENLKNENIRTLNDIIEEIAFKYEFDDDCEDSNNVDDLIEKKKLTHRELEEAKL